MAALASGFRLGVQLPKQILGLCLLMMAVLVAFSTEDYISQKRIIMFEKIAILEEMEKDGWYEHAYGQLFNLGVQGEGETIEKFLF